jgi:hypothetical protein
MRGKAGPWLIDSWMTSLRATAPFVALHTGAPSADDPTATEVTGGWYSRKGISWDALDDTACANAGPVSWSSMPAVTIAGVSVYTTSTGSALILWVPYITPVSVIVGGSITVGAHELYIEIV